MPQNPYHPHQLSRRTFSRFCAATAALAFAPFGAATKAAVPKARGASAVLSLDRDWLFAKKTDAAELDAGFNNSAFARITLPHCVAPLS